MIKRLLLVIACSLYAFGIYAQEPGFSIKFYLKNNNDTIWVANPDYKVTVESVDKTSGMRETMKYTEQGKDVFKYGIYGSSDPTKRYVLNIARSSTNEVMKVAFNVAFPQKTLELEVSLGAIVFKKGIYEFIISKDVPATEYGYKVPAQSEWKKKQ